MAKPIEKIIHEAERFHHKGNIIYPNFKKRLESSGLSFIFISPNTLNPLYTVDPTVNSLYHVQGVTLVYFYSPGSGSFPNEREKITAYGSEEDISNLEDKLALKAGTPK